MELSEQMKKYTELKDKIKELKAEQEELRTNILIECKTNDINNYEDDDNQLRLITQTRKTFDKQKALTKLEEHGEDSSAFFTESDYEILKVDKKK